MFHHSKKSVKHLLICMVKFDQLTFLFSFINLEYCPDSGRGVAFDALSEEAVHAVDVGALMVAAQHEEVLHVLNFESEHEHDRF